MSLSNTIRSAMRGRWQPRGWVSGRVGSSADTWTHRGSRMDDGRAGTRPPDDHRVWKPGDHHGSCLPCSSRLLAQALSGPSKATVPSLRAKPQVSALHRLIELTFDPSHGGSQGFKSPHLHPTTDDQRKRWLSLAPTPPWASCCPGSPAASGAVDRQQSSATPGQCGPCAATIQCYYVPVVSNAE